MTSRDLAGRLVSIDLFAKARGTLASHRGLEVNGAYKIGVGNGRRFADV
jgi:hypothetical protein